MVVRKSKYLYRKYIDKILLYLGIIVSIAILVQNGFNTDHSQELLFETVCGYIFTLYTFILGGKLLLLIGEKMSSSSPFIVSLIFFCFF